MSILVTGGARSGKSSFAEKLCMSLDKEAVYVATAQAFDEEMTGRIALHRLQRIQAEYAWQTIEEPLKLAEKLRTWRVTSDQAPTVLVDCLTLWLSNVLLALEEEPDMEQKVETAMDELMSEISAYPGQLVLVTNEVGSGIVPAYRLGRQFRDFAGFLNQAVARSCTQVFLVTAGIPIELKSREYHL
ncbi:bifunctional adenosylcobinamide kinase/adenosylcobinamide-phosphate guanylyltransferase [Paenibacillus pini]|uniref:Adenosylcobinamide kinase n=1 Tax=Paenibacillus pini JCM 16418 TaxID=1236976 RepID=W7YCC0_9BACL|nr:bifunctional adenosylcobinamide kinase/adenosylcobinamide-phosphate guanylyltransferase [Paenibacillus pini]GAF06092.1 adenosylcobinamide-phosphate guanylyltransferase [Paenibacillus pini JCM 16418]